MLLVLVDSREQLPLFTNPVDGVDKVEVIGLPFGDYTAMIMDANGHGRQIPVCFDRKGLGDLFSTMTHGYDRFKRVMERAKANSHKLILITEGTYSEVLAGYSHSEFSGEAMVKKLATLSVKYDLEWWPCESRQVMEQRIVDTFLAVGRVWEKASS